MGRQSDRLTLWPVILLVCLSLIAYATALLPAAVRAQGSAGYSLRVFGHGVDDIDRVKIPVQNASGSLPTDIGATDFTIEFWLRGTLAENRGAAIVCGANEDWIYGSIVLDRDRFAQGRKFGLSLDSAGRVVFGVTNEQSVAQTICGATSVLDGQWHHIAVQRRAADGELTIYVDGQPDATATGPAGDISYPDGVSVSYQGPTYCQGPGGAWGGYCLNEPYIVLGAEKHDAGASEGNPSAYPSFSGYIDEVRLSTNLRYASAFLRPHAPFAADAHTAALYHFDEGPTGACTGRLIDSASAAGSTTAGACAYGGVGTAGPQYSSETPFAATASTATRTPTHTPTPAIQLPPATFVAATATSTSTPTPRPPTPTAVPATATFSLLPTSTSTATPTAVPPTVGPPTATAISAQNHALAFDGVDDVVITPRLNHSTTLTVELWVRPSVGLMDAIVINQATDNAGWSLELNAGRPSLWVATSNGWQVARHSTRLVGGTWYHVAATYNNGAVRVYVNGQPGTTSTLQTGISSDGSLSFGGVPGYERFAGTLDDVRVSRNIRYTSTFTPPSTLPTPDASTLGQWVMNEGRGQTAVDSSSAQNAGQLGLLSGADAADPTWVVGR